MADDIDRAQDIETWHREAAIEAVREAAYSGEAASDCIECGLQIPSERQLAAPGCQMCVDCAARAEADARSR